MHATRKIYGLIARMEEPLRRLEASPDTLGGAFFLATYLRTTKAVADNLAAGAFVDTARKEAWDIAFANLYLDAVEQ